MVRSCRCWPGSAAATKQEQPWREEAEEATRIVDELARAVTECYAELDEKRTLLSEAVQRRETAEVATTVAEADIEVLKGELAVARGRAEARENRVRTLRRRLQEIQAQDFALRAELDTSSWRPGHERLLASLRAESMRIESKLADQRRLNHCRLQGLRSRREALDALLEFGDQQACALAAVRGQNDRLELEVDQVGVKVGTLQGASLATSPLELEGYDQERVEQLQRSVHLSDLAIAKLEKDLLGERRLVDIAEAEAAEAISRLHAERSEVAAAAAAASAAAAFAAREKQGLAGVLSESLAQPAFPRRANLQVPQPVLDSPVDDHGLLSMFDGMSTNAVRSLETVEAVPTNTALLQQQQQQDLEPERVTAVEDENAEMLEVTEEDEEELLKRLHLDDESKEDSLLVLDALEGAPADEEERVRVLTPAEAQSLRALT